MRQPAWGSSTRTALDLHQEPERQPPLGRQVGAFNTSLDCLYTNTRAYKMLLTLYDLQLRDAPQNATLLEHSLKQSVDRAWPTSPDDSYAVRIKRSLLKSSMSWLVWTLSKLDLEHIMKKVGDHVGQGNVRFTVNGRRVDPAEVRRRYTAYATKRRSEL